MAGDIETSHYARYPSLAGRVVVVTGGATGIGESLVEHFVEQGSQVAFLDIQDDAGEVLASQLSAGGRPAPMYIHCDLTSVDSLRAATVEIAERFGRIDVLVNNAGDDTRHALEEVTPEYWDNSMAVNLRQQFFMAQAVIPLMSRSGSGSIINMSSISWLIPSVHQVVYVTAKAAIVGLTRTLAHELGSKNIRVNCILPGAIVTERQARLWLTDEYKAEVLAAQAIKRLLAPAEVARMALFLAADDSSAVTNQNFVVDGGWI